MKEENVEWAREGVNPQAKKNTKATESKWKVVRKKEKMVGKGIDIRNR